MQFDLLTTEPTEPTDAPASNADAAADVPAPMPGEVEALERVYRAEMALRAEVAVRAGQLAAELEAIKGLGFEPLTIGRRNDVEINYDCLAAYVGRIEGLAEKLLSCDGAPFTGTLQRYAAKARGIFSDCYRGSGRDSDLSPALEAFSPKVLWREISSQFDREAQRQAANLRAARTIRGFFGMLRGTPGEMKVVKGRVEVPVRVCTSVSFRGERTLSHSSRTHELGAALQQCIDDAGLDLVFGRRLSDLCEGLSESHRRPIVSRERVDLGDGVDVVLGFEQFKLYLPQSIADTVNMFLAEQPCDTH